LEGERRDGGGKKKVKAPLTCLMPVGNHPLSKVKEGVVVAKVTGNRWMTLRLEGKRSLGGDTKVSLLRGGEKRSSGKKSQDYRLKKNGGPTRWPIESMRGVLTSGYP